MILTSCNNFALPEASSAKRVGYLRKECSLKVVWTMVGMMSLVIYGYRRLSRCFHNLHTHRSEERNEQHLLRAEEKGARVVNGRRVDEGRLIWRRSRMVRKELSLKMKGRLCTCLVSRTDAMQPGSPGAAELGSGGVKQKLQLWQEWAQHQWIIGCQCHNPYRA